ncbi:hypothetical protein KSS87_009098, partial [Heliosperma pusillum]
MVSFQSVVTSLLVKNYNEKTLKVTILYYFTGYNSISTSTSSSL